MPQNKHRDIFDALKSEIANGKCDFSKPLPSVSLLMRKFGVARATAVAALKALEREGLAESRRGSGTYPVKREPITFGVIVPEAERPFYSRVCTGIANFANNSGGGAIIRCYGRIRRLRPLSSFGSSPRCARIRTWRACSSRGFAMVG